MSTQPVPVVFPIRRPALRYHGGKFRLAPLLIELFPPHRVYTEAYGGGRQRAPAKTTVLFGNL